MGAVRAVDKLDHVVREVVDGGHVQACGRGAQGAAAGDFFGRKTSTGAAVDGRAIAGVRCARGVELGARAKAGVGKAGVLQLVQGGLVQVQAIVLVVGAFVPLEPQPSEVGDELGGELRSLAAIV